jgi:putative ATPase
MSKKASSSQATLFAASRQSANQPDQQLLTELLRPQNLDDVIGQTHLVGPKGSLRRVVDQHYLPSLIFWGPPGSGKTTLARLLANAFPDHHWVELSAVMAGVADLRHVFAEAEDYKQTGRKTILFIDEIHRFNRAQQDALLPVVENGTIILLGATTENPSFSLNGALLSRANVMVLQRHDAVALEQLLQRAEEQQNKKLPIDEQARATLIALADGDARYLLRMVETLWAVESDTIIEAAELLDILNQRAPLYDAKEEAHYNLISALHKAVRGSDVDAALYWLARMLSAGEDPDFLARRIVRMASEDVGLADPNALPQAIAAWQAFERLGTPEGELMLAQAVAYVALAPKSNAIYTAYKDAQSTAQNSGSLAPPPYAMNAPTKLMKKIGYGQGYIYDHDTPEGFSGLDYFPPDLPREQFYQPVARGFERDLQKRLDYFQRLREQKHDN